MRERWLDSEVILHACAAISHTMYVGLSRYRCKCGCLTGAYRIYPLSTDILVPFFMTRASLSIEFGRCSYGSSLKSIGVVCRRRIKA